jgi:hypothetical protein
MLTDQLVDAQTIHTLPTEFCEQGLYVDFRDALVIMARGLGQLVTCHPYRQAQANSSSLCMPRNRCSKSSRSPSSRRFWTPGPLLGPS